MRSSPAPLSREKLTFAPAMRYLFLLILLLPCAAQAYVTWRTVQLVPFPLWAKVAVALAFLLCFILFFVALSPLVDRLPLDLGSAVYEIGNSWLVVMLYLFMAWLVVDALRLCHVVPDSLVRGSGPTTALLCGLLCVVFGLAYLQYNNKVRVRVNLETSKPLVAASLSADSAAAARPLGADSLRIVMTSDWHLGYHNRRRELARWVDLINAERPDLILIAGDLIDHHIHPLLAEGMDQELRRLSAPVYACLGNHEYLSGEPRAEKFLRDAGVRLLRDSVAHVGPIDVIGRDDRSNPGRRPLTSLMADVRPGAYTILLDHQPYHLEEAEAAGVDFELAGHTHHGQVWPGNWITDALYECAFGEHRRGRTRYYVSSGLGIWGAKFRIATRSEYVVATLKPSPANP